MTCSDLRDTERHWCQWTLGYLSVLMLFAGILFGCYSVVCNRTQRERVAANELQKMGATFDTWVGWEEVVLGTDYARIVQVDLCGVRDIRAAMRHLDALSHIEDMSLSGTSIVDSDLEHFRHLSNLTSLDLSNTRVTDAGLDYLQGLENLRWLTLDKNEITDAGIERLRQRLPRIEVKASSVAHSPDQPGPEESLGGDTGNVGRDEADINESDPSTWPGPAAILFSNAPKLQC